MTSVESPKVSTKPTHSFWVTQLSVGRIAFLIGIVVIITGGVSSGDLAYMAQAVTLPLASLMGLSIIALSAHEVGVFNWLAGTVAQASGGNGLLLFTNVFFMSAIVTVIFPNDATILLFTPLVVSIVQEVHRTGSSMCSPVPVLYAIVFGANAASIALITSNPINMILTSQFDLPYLTYASWMILPGIASTLACYGLLRWVFRSEFTESVDIKTLGDVAAQRFGGMNPLLQSVRRRVHDEEHQSQPVHIVIAVLVVLGMFISYFILSALGITYHYAILAGSLALLWPVWQTKNASLHRVFRDLPWDALLFVAGTFVVAFWFSNNGLIHLLSRILQGLADGSLFQVAVGNSFLTALSANLINDWPTATLSVIAIEALPHGVGDLQNLFIFTAIIGANLGNKILPFGSLATLIWMTVIQRISGIRITWGQFIKVGLLVTPLTLLAAVLCLWFEFILFGSITF